MIELLKIYGNGICGGRSNDCCHLNFASYLRLFYGVEYWSLCHWCCFVPEALWGGRFVVFQLCHCDAVFAHLPIDINKSNRCTSTKLSICSVICIDLNDYFWIWISFFAAFMMCMFFFLLHSNFQYSMYCFGKISSIQMYLYSYDISMGIQNK